MQKLLPTNEDKVKFMMSKYWNEADPAIAEVEIPEWWMKFYRQPETIPNEE
jgi:hypothetical protein